MPEPIQVGLVMEQAMGHVTHGRALADAAEGDPSVQVVWMPVPYRAADVWQRLPGVRDNLSLLLSLRARGQIRRHQNSGTRFDALFYHTQVMSHFSLGLMRRIPTVLSLDATPLNVDPAPPAAAGPFTRRPGRRGVIHRLKFRWTRAALRRAAAITTWNNWARDSVVGDYGIPAERVIVIPPGVDLNQWRPGCGRDAPGGDAPGRDRLPRLLLVASHFERKGGPILLELFRRELRGRAELHIATGDPSVAPEPGVHVHRGHSINSPGLRRLYQQADLFLLPTLNDCTPLAIIEAMASGLPVVASDVGAIRELVEDGATGLLVRPADAGDLGRAIGALLDDPPRLRAMGDAGRVRAETHFCARRNYGQIIELLRACAHRRTGDHGSPARGQIREEARHAASSAPTDVEKCQTGC